MGIKQYTSEYNIEAVTLAKGVGVEQAAVDLDIPMGAREARWDSLTVTP